MKKVVITGGARRLGRGLALEFARSGWDVAIIFNESAVRAAATLEELKEVNSNSLAVQADISSKEQVESAFAKIYGHFGNIDVLVNNAGVFPATKNFTELTSNDWDFALNINARGAFICSQEFAKYSSEQSKIVNIVSNGAFEIWKDRLPYNVSKAAAIQLTKAMAKALAPKIAVNAVCPGSILMPDDPSENDAFLQNPMSIPMKRHGAVSDIFEAVWFFANCTNFITGQYISVDGGAGI
jgi:NAD(P)-dependent dehydrogenase (short-subunit alcohol dehydrogenase family)